ncbi:hypothetical protein ACFW04_014787 [Cataglyphis niger]
MHVKKEQQTYFVVQFSLGKHNEAEKIAANTLKKVFTPGQIKMLMSPNNKMKLSSDDITSKYKKIPLRCETTLHNCCASFNIPLSILKDVLNILKDRGHNLCTLEKLTVLTFDELYISNKKILKNNILLHIQQIILFYANIQQKFFFYADVPHLLKLDCLEKLLKINVGDLKIAHKLSRTHLDVKETQRQNVKLAAQIFSNKNAVAIKWCEENSLLKSKQWKKTADIFKLFNDWFDVFNSKNKYGYHSGTNAYGINLEEQNQVINNMNKFIIKFRVGQRSKLLLFQK